LEEGDIIEVDIDERRISVDLSEAELARRREVWKKPEPHYTSGVMAKYAYTARQADDGAISNVMI
jgi:dihydroxy-acid dehydratase